MGRFTKIGILSLAALLALGACSKGSQSTSTTTTTTEQGGSAAPAETATAAGTESAMSNAASPAAGAANGAVASDGAKVYQTNCSSCHQASGQGVPGTFPPLAGNPAVSGDATKVIHIVKFGLNGKVDVKGTSYNGMMPAWGQQLSNGDIAAVVTYIRSSWGNSAGAVTEAQVAGVTK
ncbi:MAG: cytochrome c [Candidatus Eremiobacteraeota bacterium]|nr:cytochrome c [Candidatus Eremiobacteraeota bacterium]